MSKRTFVAGAVAVLVALGAAYALRDHWFPNGAVAQAPPAARVVPVDVATAIKKPSPAFLEALGTVTPIETVAVRSRVDTEIVKVHFQDGATVKAGDVLFTLDSRAIEAQIRQAEGNLARDRAQLEGAERDVRRFTELVAKNATPVVNLDNAKTSADMFRAAIRADQGALENLKVQLSYCTIRAPISGRISAAAVKVGNFVRASDTAPIATINQMAPIYISFGVPQRSLANVRRALVSEGALVEAIVPGEERRATGQLSMIENTVDPTTGMVMLRATMENSDQLLWPGALVTAQLTLFVKDAVIVPTAAVLTGQAGTYVFVVKDNAVSVRPVKVARSNERETAIESGVEEGEVVVTSGQLLLTNGTKVSPHEAKVGS